MAMEYFHCYHSYRRRCEKLTDQELGRLFRALLEYSETGETQELAGRESIAFDFIADDIDRAKTAYEAKCRGNAENGRKGGRPPKEETNGFSENPKKANGFSENPKKPKEKAKAKAKEKAKANEKEEITPLPPLLCAGAMLEAAFSEWLAYKAERKESYQPTGLKNLVSQVRNNAGRYGEEAVAMLIRECMANGWKGIIFDRLKQQKIPADTQKREEVNTTNPFLQFTGGGRT